jgi:YHS domain-containing protein
MTFRDPVCGAAVNVRSAVAAENYGRFAYYFCSEDCHMRFVDDPGRYAACHQIPRPTIGAVISRSSDVRMLPPSTRTGVAAHGSE